VTSPPTSLNVDSSCDSDADDDSSSFSISALRSSAVSPPVALYRIVTLGTGGRLYARIWPIYIFVTSISDLLLTSSYPFNGPLSVTTRVSRYQKGKTNLDFTEARDSEWQWNQLGQMQVCTSLQTDNHASTPTLSFFTGRMPLLPPNQQWRHFSQTLGGLTFHTRLLLRVRYCNA